MIQPACKFTLATAAMLPTGYLCSNGELCIICYVHVYLNFYICRRNLSVD